MKFLHGVFFCALTIVTALLPLHTAWASTQNLTLDGDHGKLAAILQRPDNKDKAPLVILMHGFTGHKNSPILTSIANVLEQEGIASLRFDFNGHGESEGRFEDMTIPNEIEDAHHVYHYAQTLPWVTSISLAGHSQGGVVAGMLAGQLGTQKVKALVLLAPAAVLRDDAIRGNVQGARFDPMNPPASVPLPGSQLRLGRNYIETVRDLPIYETSAQYQGPVLIINGTGDTTVPYTYSERYQRIYFHGQLKLLKGEDHLFTHDRAGMAKLVADFFKQQVNME